MPRRTDALLVALTVVAVSVSSVMLPGLPAGASERRPTVKAGTLAVQAPGVTVLEKGATGFVPALDGQSVKAGDTVQTDAGGYAEIRFPDGSVTRLDHATVFSIEALATRNGKRRIQASVRAGQTWNRVQKLTKSVGSTYEQKGGGATAAVLGTGFRTRCSPVAAGTVTDVVTTRKALRELVRTPQVCNFTLVDGEIELATPTKVVDVIPGQQVTVVAGAAGKAEFVAPDVLLADRWISDNLAADAEAGIIDTSGQPTADDLKVARIEGSWPVTLTVTDPGGFRNLAEPLSRTYTVTNDCSSGSCVLTLSAETPSGIRTVPLSFADGVYTAEDPDLGTQDCVLDDGTIPVPSGLRNSTAFSFTAVAAVLEEGVWRATGLSGTVTETATQVAGAAGECQSGTATFAFAASR